MRRHQKSWIVGQNHLYSKLFCVIDGRIQSVMGKSAVMSSRNQSSTKKLMKSSRNNLVKTSSLSRFSLSKKWINLNGFKFVSISKFCMYLFIFLYWFDLFDK